MYDIYRYIFIGALVLALLMLAATVFLFFFLNISDAIGDLTGSNKRKEMERIKDGGVVKKNSQAKKKVKKAFDNSTQQTSRLSIQDRYDAMETDTAPLVPNGAPAPKPEQKQVRRQSPNRYVPVAINAPDFVMIDDITYVHSTEIIA